VGILGLVTGAADVTLGEDSESKIGLGTGAVIFALGMFDRDAERSSMLKVIGGAVVAFFFLREQKRVGTPVQAVEDAAALPADNAGVSAFEKALGVLGRAVGLEPEVGIEQTSERAADESKGPFLGAPKNALRVAGAWRQPLPGGNFAVAAFSNTFQAFAVLENQSASEVAGQVRVRILHQGLLQGDLQTTMVDGPAVRLAPGELRELGMRLPAVRDADGKIELALYFAGFNLASISAQRSLVLS
jgi:hypothetical protein